MVKYNERQLWNVPSSEVKTWNGKSAVVVLKDGNIIEGMIREIQCAGNENVDDGVREYLWHKLKIENQEIDIINLKSIEP